MSPLVDYVSFLSRFISFISRLFFSISNLCLPDAHHSFFFRWLCSLLSELTNNVASFVGYSLSLCLCFAYTHSVGEGWFSLSLSFCVYFWRSFSFSLMCPVFFVLFPAVTFRIILKHCV